MKPARSFWCLLILTAWTSFVVWGCDRPPAPPKNPQGRRIKMLSVSPAQREELKAATAAEAARINYRYRLQVLSGYYDRVGNVDKRIWTERETKNLDTAWTFVWDGLPEITRPAGESIEDADERLLVEYVAAARNEYTDAVAKLADFYRQGGRDFEARLIQNVQDRFDPVRTYMYYFAAEMPALAKPSTVIPEADVLFAEALKLHDAGKGILRFAVTTNYPKQRQALLKFRELVAKYPTSNRAPESCYYVGELYKEYFNEDLRAVLWYERAWQLDPNIAKPARFQAATVYDFRLQDKITAIECYRLVIQHEQFNPGNVRYAHQRIGELTGSTPEAQEKKD
jgi:hypothetical protein